MSDNDEELTEYQSGLLEIVRRRIPATAHEVATALGMLSAEMEKTRQDLDAAEMDYTEKSEEYNREFDKAFLTEIAKDDRVGYATIARAKARDATWELSLAMKQAKVEMERLQRRINILDRRMFVGQSIGKTIRSEHRNIGYGNWGS